MYSGTVIKPYWGCNDYEESYIKSETDAPIGCSSLEEFSKKYGTNYR